MPLNAWLQDLASESHRARVISALNLMNALSGILATLVGFGLKELGLTASLQVMTFVPFARRGIVPALAAAEDRSVRNMRRFAQLFFRYALGWPVHLIYRARRTGTEHVPREGGVLLLGNHVSYVDSFIVYMCCPRRPVRFVVLERFTRMKAIGWFLRLFDPIPIDPKRSRQAIERTIEALRNGDVVCLFPEGGLTRMGVMQEFKKGFELIVRRAECPVVPVYMDGLWESIFSFERGRYFKKWPHGFTCPLQVAFGRPIPPKEATVARVREAVMEQSVEAFSLRRELTSRWRRRWCAR